MSKNLNLQWYHEYIGDLLFSCISVFDGLRYFANHFSQQSYLDEKQLDH